ncbi:MAG: hypothetical protein RSB70_06835 [Clostridium sp.]
MKIVIDFLMQFWHLWILVVIALILEVFVPRIKKYLSKNKL